MVQIRRWLLSSLVTVLQYASDVEADGTGLLGYGKTLYNPTCAFACRSVIRKQTLSCTPMDSHQNHGTAHNPVSTPAKCFVKDPTFLKTMALCIDTYCSLSDKPKISLLEDYWASHLGTGTLGDYQFVPVMSYKDALAAAREDENNATMGTGLGFTSASVPKGLTPYKVSSSLPITTGGSGSLNKTSLVAPVQWQLQFNYLSDFEINEKGHSTMTIVIVVVAIAVPILLSLTRFIPAATVNSAWSRLKAVLIDAPVFGRYHRTPVLGGLVPTRGHSLYIFLISLLNLVLLVAPYTIKQPQASFTTKGKQLLSIIGNRAGTMAMGNAVALILFSSRNSFLLYLTDWSYSTYLLLHRWLGYWTVLHTIIHSAMLCSYYVQAGSYSAEILRLYWQWGIVGTVAVCAIIPFSLLVVRQKLYEFFIVSHIVLSLLFLIGYYYHIWYVYTYNWGYEIWMFIAAAVWAVERLARLIRMAVQGSNTAVVTVLQDVDDEYIRIDIEGKDYKEGVAYLCFPSLSWRFWETHPFSVCYSSSDFPQASSLHSHSDAESNTSSRPNADPEKVPNGNITSVEARGVDVRNRTSGTTFYARTRSGVTKALLNKAAASEGRQVRLQILVDGPYNHSGRVHSQLERCSSILCITGGVGITACLAFLRDSKAKDINLFWSSRKSGLVADLTPTLNALPSNVKVETLVGQRHDLDSIIRHALLNDTSSGPLAILVSGPPGLADDVRVKVVQTVGSSKQSRPYLLLDEAFSW